MGVASTTVVVVAWGAVPLVGASACTPGEFGVPVVVDQAASFFSEKPHLVRDDTSDLHLVYISCDRDRPLTFPTYTFSDDDGQTWTAGQAITDTSSVPKCSKARLVVFGETVGVVWEPSESVGDRPIWFSRQDPGGKFSVVSEVVDGALRGTIVDVLVLPSGRLICYYVRIRPDGRRDHYVAWSDDQGESWESSSEPIGGMDEPSNGSVVVDGAIAVGDTDSELYVVYEASNQVLCFRYGGDGKPWVRSVVMENVPAPDVTVAVSPSGNVGVAWDWNPIPTGSIGVSTFFAHSGDGGASWADTVRVSVGGPAGNYYNPLLATDEMGTWHVGMLWNIPHTDTVHYYYTCSANSGETWLSPPLQLGGEPFPMFQPYHSLVADSEGNAYASWARHLGDFAETWVVFRTNADAATPIEPAPDTVGLGGDFQAFPVNNPSGSTLALQYHIPRAADIVIALWDAQGRVVRRWHVGHNSAGNHLVEWDGFMGQGRVAESGTYFWEVTAEGAWGRETARAKSVLVR